MLTIIHQPQHMQQAAERLRQEGKRIAFVPTMGYLHDGHITLMQTGQRMADILIVSIFVNPIQFGPAEDFDTYPRDLERDLEMCRSQQVDIVFTPDKAALYPDGFETRVRLDRLPNHLCGIHRPVFFIGVATVVAKLFNIIRPHLAVFGEKDYQQLLIIRKMVRDLNFDVEIVAAPTVREKDGLALSSRNAYLAEQERPAALSLYRSLTRAAERVRDGETNAAQLLAEAGESIRRSGRVGIEYISICDPDTLEEIEIIDRPVRMAMAVRVGKTRLIDNMMLRPQPQAKKKVIP